MHEPTVPHRETPSDGSVDIELAIPLGGLSDAQRAMLTALLSGVAGKIERHHLEQLLEALPREVAATVRQMLAANVLEHVSVGVSGAEPREERDGKPAHRAVCDGCDGRIYGVRYKCANCADYDLCETCEERAEELHDAEHVFYKIRKPVPRGSNVRSQGSFYAPPAKAPAKAKRVRYKARFVADVSVPDGTVLGHGAKFVKVWRLRNDGETAWPADATLSLHGGDRLGADGPVLVGAVPPGEHADVAVRMTAPEAPGRYVGYWRLQTAERVRFGHRVWVDIRVDTQAPAPVEPVAPVPVVPAEPAVPLVAPVPVPPVALRDAEVYEYAEQRDQLVRMGFADTDLMRAVLSQTKGDVLRSVEALLSQ